MGKTEVSVFSISILSGKKREKTRKPSRFEKLRLTQNISDLMSFITKDTV